jgi:hypothetical protein
VFAQRFTLPPLATLDIDGNSQVQPLTDGLLYLRHRFGFAGDSLINSAVGPNCTRCGATDIKNYLNGLDALFVLDVYDEGLHQPLTDGLLTLRYLFGFTGTTLTDNALGTGCVNRCNAAQIVAYLQTLD